MRTKALITALLLGTSLASVASADPFVRDHRQQPTFVPSYARSRFVHDSRLQRRPSWMQYTTPYTSNTYNNTYGYQLDADGDEVIPYNQGQDPYVEGIARGEWSLLKPCVELEGRHSVRIDLSGRSLRSVEIQATRGGANLVAAGIMFSDGTQMPITLNRAIDVNGAPNLRLDLGPHGRVGINAIVLEGSGNASFRVIGG